MLIHPVIEKLQQLRLSAMASTLKNQSHHTELETLTFEERLSLLVDIEITDRDNRRCKLDYVAPNLSTMLALKMWIIKLRVV